MIPPVAPLEATMAVIGLRTIISKKVEKVRRATLDRIDGFDKEIARRAREVVNGELTEAFYSDLNHRAMLHDLSEGFNVTQVQKMADLFPAKYRDLGLALAGAAPSVIAALMKLAPTSSYETLTGAKQLRPSDVAVWRFVSILDVLDDPMLIFPLMNTGALLRSQANAVRSLYPTFSAAVDAALLEATIKAKARLKSFELPPRAEVGVQCWASTSITASPEVAMQRKGRLQASQQVAAKSKADQEKRAAVAQAKKAVSMTETQAQRSDPAAP